MDYTLWKNRSKNIYNFFNENIDRIYVANDLFPKIGNYLKNTNKNKILNIGLEDYNIYDKFFFQNDDIYICGLDKNSKNIPNYNNIYQCDLTKDIVIELPLFDVIIDYGVIGWPGVNMNLSQNDICKYINNIYSILDDDGLYFIKIDYKSPEHNEKNRLLLEIIKEKFNIYIFEGHNIKILSQTINNTQIIYENYVFAKK
jgi:hypothetical protein